MIKTEDIITYKGELTEEQLIEIKKEWKRQMEKQNIRETLENLFSHFFFDSFTDSGQDTYSIMLNEINKVTGIDKLKIHSFLQWQKKMIITFIIKNMAYKDSYKKHGIIGIIIRISDKIDRVFNLEMNDLKKGFVYSNDESKLDTFLDIAVYCILSLMELNNRNE